MKTIKLTKKEIRALLEQLDANACSSGCAFSEMQRSKKDYDECEFPRLISSSQARIPLPQRALARRWGRNCYFFYKIN